MIDSVVTLNAPDDVAPPRPERLRSGFVQWGDEIVLDYRSGSLAGGVFLSLWLAGWGAGCVLMLQQLLNNPQPFLILFATPFITAWIVVSLVRLHAFLGRERFCLGPNGASYSRRVLKTLVERTVPLEEIVDFQEVDVASAQNQPLAPALQMRTLGAPVQFGAALPALERDWLRHVLSQHLAVLQQGIQVPGPDDPVVAAPHDNRWAYMTDFDAFAFEHRGRFEPATVAGLLFINAFWNGIVAVFVAVALGLAPGQALPPAVRWGLGVFLIPFEVIGLCMFAAFLLALLEPVRITRWRISNGEVQYSVHRLGVGRRRTCDVNGLERIDVVAQDDADSGGPWKFPDLSPISQSPLFRWELVFVGLDGAEVCTIGKLTRGEAQWMRGVIQSERAEWFR